MNSLSFLFKYQHHEILSAFKYLLELICFFLTLIHSWMFPWRVKYLFSPAALLANWFLPVAKSFVPQTLLPVGFNLSSQKFPCMPQPIILMLLQDLSVQQACGNGRTAALMPAPSIMQSTRVGRWCKMNFQGCDEEVFKSK